ncbi:hypothetical protein EX30DRAFT_327437 [Ascodesmis nigricans]|uniref:Fumarylacetoacetase-like C-terminal domain-containing protein n=1 Tax=Ascodesmis nigricans TaxID=341454 RepID=A0A4S2N3G4_9PEZI|nr:hypothetical protein EX30DRAFT_327437 [Ascodesmis nigricans]
MSKFTRLIRFLSSGTVHYGDAILPAGVTDLSQARQARKIVGDVFGEHSVTADVLNVEKLLPPLPQSAVPTVRCLGLNYAAHAKESNMPLPQYPILFYKPTTSLSGHLFPLPIPPIAQTTPEATIDYETELVIIIGRSGRNIPASQALSHVLGYTVGNDVSQRTWQIERGGSQWSMGKCYDGWAPFGPGIVTTEVLGDAGDLRIVSRVNGEVRQDSRTSDMVFGVKETIAFLSQGTTLRKGDVIFLGTPQGVAMGMKGVKKWLRDGDEVEVELEGVGKVSNKVVFEKEAVHSKL